VAAELIRTMADIWKKWDNRIKMKMNDKMFVFENDA
jgi:hypothetical protein